MSNTKQSRARQIGDVCPRGHRITSKNVRVTKSGPYTSLSCGICYRNYQREYKRQMRNSSPERYRV